MLGLSEYSMLRLSEYDPAFRMHITYIKEGKE
jgi:hypothetical protein